MLFLLVWHLRVQHQVCDVAVRYIVNFYARHSPGGNAAGDVCTRMRVPRHCVECGRYLRGKCHREFRAGFAVCRNGLYVFCERESNLVFWGLSVNGEYDASRVHSVEGVVSGTETILRGLIQSELKTRLLVSRFAELVIEMGNVNQSVNAIYSSFNDMKGGEERIVTVSTQSVIKATAAANLLSETRRQIHREIMTFVADDFLNVGSNCAVCAVSNRRCIDCLTKSCCEHIDSDVVQMCTHEVEFIKIGGLVFPGIGKRDMATRDGMVRLKASGMTRENSMRVAAYVLQRHLFLRPVRRFLHDAGQYISGLQNVLPQIRETGSLQMMLVDVRTVIALSVALRFLKACFEIKAFSRDIPSPKYVSLYRMFDRYRYCFSDRGLRIELKVSPPAKDFFKQARCPFGFERIILNLFGNAVKYLPPEYRMVTVLFSEVEAGATIRISSLGPKLDEDELRKLGHHCFRGRLARENFDGEGMGLCLVREYVENSGMSIVFEQSGQVCHSGDMPYQMFSAVLSIPLYLMREESLGDSRNLKN